jgi:PleD family two-component response regulator
MPEHEAGTRPPFVLIANDQEWSGRSLETILAPRGYAVLRAFTGRQALEAARRARPDVVIVDARMPDVEGIELCRRLRDEHVVSLNTPIILTSSGQMTRAQTVAAFNAGAWDVCHYPVDGELLILRLETFVGAKRDADLAREESLVDSTTGLYNLRGLVRRGRELAAEALRANKALACLAVTPRAVGSASADDLLDEPSSRVAEHLGAALLRCMRASDVVGHVGRLEFAIIAPNTAPEGAEQLLRRMQIALEAAPFSLADAEQKITIRGSYYAVPNYATTAVDTLEMLERASSGLRAHARADLMVMSARLGAIPLQPPAVN